MRCGKPGNKRTGYGKIAVLAGVLCLMIPLGGCGAKDDDPAGRQVLEISITPEPTPTPVPEQLNPDAVVTEGSLTMVNGYLVEGIGTTRRGKGKLNTGASEEEENPDSGEEGKTDSGEGDINSEDGTDTNSEEGDANSEDEVLNSEDGTDTNSNEENTDSEDEESADFGDKENQNSEKSEGTDSDI